MQDITILYWRDIPAQLLSGRGRAAKKYILPEKYEKAIDRCAMRVGAKSEDDYMRGWRKVTIKASNSGQNFLTEEARKIMLSYDDEKLKYLIKNEGWDSCPGENKHEV